MTWWKRESRPKEDLQLTAFLNAGFGLLWYEKAVESPSILRFGGTAILLVLTAWCYWKSRQIPILPLEE